MSDNNQKPTAWGQNKNIPDSWGKNNKLPENWGKQSSNADSGTPSVRTKATSSASTENTANLSDKARSSVGLLAAAAKKVGGAAKNTAGNAVEYAKSDGFKDKLNAAKNKAKSIADSAGSSLADIKEKTSDAINERRVSKSELSDDNTSDEIVEDTSDTAIAEDTLIADSFDYTSFEDNETFAEPSAEADTDYYVPDEADDKVYETEQEEEYAYSENDVVEETSDYDESELAEEYEEDVADNAAFESEGSLKKNIIIGAIVLAVGIGAITGIGYFYKNSIENKKHSTASEIESNISDTQDIEANSDNLRKATLSALTEMSEEGYNLGGTYIISSLQDYNTDLPSGNFDIDKFYKKVNIFFNKSDSYQWFVLVKDEGVSVASIGTEWDDKVIDSWNSDNGSSIPNETLQDLYNKAKDSLHSTVSEEAPIIADQYTSDEVSSMFSSYISENPDPNRTYEGSDYGYALIDLNDDGKQELLVTSGEIDSETPGLQSIYAIENNKLKQLWLSDPRTIGTLCEDNIIRGNYIYGNGYGVAFYRYYSDCVFEMFESISYDGSNYANSGNYIITYNDNSTITEEAANEIIAKYKYKSYNTNPLKINIVPESKTEPTTAKQELKETYAFYGVVSTESGTLNLRDKPSIDSNVIKELPKGTKGSIYYIDGYSDWYKMYTDDGQSGFVSAQYIKEYTENDNSNVSTSKSTQVKADGSSVDPSGIKFYLKNDTPIEFSNYSDGVLISTVRVDKVEYEIINFAPSSKRNDSDFGKFYVKLYFNLTKTYDRYSAEERYGSNPSLYFKITNLTTGKSICAKSCDGKATSHIGYYDVLKREGDTEFYEWYSREDLHDEYGNGIQVYRDSEYMITIMDYAEMCNS